LGRAPGIFPQIGDCHNLPDDRCDSSEAIATTAGEPGGASRSATLQAAETACELCYRLYTLCERKKRATEALAYNSLVQSWPEITRLAREGGNKPRAARVEMFEEEIADE
jgi:putative DNA methylase